MRVKASRDQVGSMFVKSTNAGSVVAGSSLKPGKPINHLLRYDGIDVLNTDK
jgi:hypothetical protein